MNGKDSPKAKRQTIERKKIRHEMTVKRHRQVK